MASQTGYLYKKEVIDTATTLHTTRPVLFGYKSLADTLFDALGQAQAGKGRDRHSNGESFEEQIICEVTGRLAKSKVGFALGQAVKKIYETTKLDDEAGIQELYGAINYIAAAIIVLKKISQPTI